LYLHFFCFLGFGAGASSDGTSGLFRSLESSIETSYFSPSSETNFARVFARLFPPGFP
jgi:hypothetical protein